MARKRKKHRPNTQNIAKSQVVSRHEKPKLVVTQDNQLVNACYTMTLNEKRLLLLAISKIDSTRFPEPGKAPISVVVSVSDWIAHYAGKDPKAAYQEVQQASRRLLRRQVTVRKGAPNYQVMNWLDSCEYQPGEACVSIVFGYTVGLYLRGLQEQFTKISLLSAQELRSFHSIRLYELLFSFKSTKTRVEPLEALRERLELKQAYPRYADFKRRVVDPSIAEINSKTDIQVSYEPIKNGRKIVSLRFIINNAVAA